MMIYVDADACPVIAIVEQIAKEFSLPVTLICDTSHVLKSGYSSVKIIGAGSDAVDFALANMCEKGDIVVTQDYGLAAMALAKGCNAINQNGIIFDSENINSFLNSRFIAGKLRRSSSKNHLKGPKKRTRDDDTRFYNAFTGLLKNNC